MIPLEHGLILAAILFVMGLSCLVIRRNLLFMLIQTRRNKAPKLMQNHAKRQNF